MMRMFGSLCLALVLAWTAVAPASATVGEFSIPETVPLNDGQLAKLRELVRSDEEAAALAAEAKGRAAPLLDKEPQPLRVIHYEGLVNTDPRRIAAVDKLDDMADVARLMRYWQTSGDPDAAAAIRRYTIAWTNTYRLTGNDVNENKFYPMLVAYDALRPTFEASDRQTIDAWVEALGQLHHQAVEHSDHLTNRYGKHLRLLAICGRILDRPEWIEAAHQGIRRFVSASLYGDGTSRDLKRRDTLTYHASSLKPPLELAMLAGEQGRSLYTWTNDRGGSLKNSVDFVVPFALGEKTREEWTHSKVGLDRRRAAAGLDKYRQGRLYDPNDATELMERASYFDEDLMRVVHHLTRHKADRFPTWLTLMNEAARPEPD